jgi:tight adherence protein C
MFNDLENEKIMLEIIFANKTASAILFAALIGICCALFAWLISDTLANVPEEQREFKDRPPIGFRIFWWPIRCISFYIEFFLPQKFSNTVLTKLRQAGLDYSISPSQFIAARLWCSFLIALLFFWILGSFDQSKKFQPNTYAEIIIGGALIGWFYPLIWQKDRSQFRKREVLKSLPFFLDIITLCVEGGLNLQGAFAQAISKGPTGPLRDEFQRVSRDIRAGKGRADALRAMSERLNEASVGNFVTAVIQAENMGTNLGPILRAQSDQRRSERFLRAEKLAMEAPVKMLFPLIAFIFPCTFVVLFFPIVMKFINAGL